MLRVLIGCERFGAVRDAFNDLYYDNLLTTFECWSNDLEGVEPEGEWNNYHYEGDVLEVAKEYGPFDMGIFFPPCTRLTVSGAHLFKYYEKEQKEAIEFVEKIWDLPIKHIAIENPVGVLSTRSKLGKPAQIIQPWQYGEPESKKTCLWLKNLPLLQPTNILELPECGYWNNQTPSGQNKLGPSADRAALRGKTYRGIALAMADQWGKLLFDS